MVIDEKIISYFDGHCICFITQTVPWKEIFTSVPFWGVAIVHFGINWGFYTLLSELPTYFDQIQHFDMSSVSARNPF